MEGGSGWLPANQTEQAMLAALDRDDRREYFRLVSRALLYLPGYSAETAADPQRFVTLDLAGQTYLLVFTSPEALGVAVAGTSADGYRTTSCAELAEKWPNPAWRLAIDAGTPIDAYLEISALAGAVDGTLAVPSAAELVTAPDDQDSPPRTELEATLWAALAAGDTDGYLQNLVVATVLMATGAPTTLERLLDDDFPWVAAGSPGTPTIAVYTSPERAVGRLDPAAPVLTAPLVAIVACWPGADHRLSIDPGARHGITLDGEGVLELAQFARDFVLEPDAEAGS